MDWKEKRKQMDTKLREIFVPELRTRNFKGSYPHFRRDAHEQIELIGISFSKQNPQFSLEIAISPLKGVTLSDGKQISPAKIKYYHATKRKTIEKDSFSFESENYDEAAIQALSSLKEAEEWWIEEEETA